MNLYKITYNWEDYVGLYTKKAVINFANHRICVAEEEPNFNDGLIEFLNKNKITFVKTLRKAIRVLWHDGYDVERIEVIRE